MKDGKKFTWLKFLPYAAALITISYFIKSLVKGNQEVKGIYGQLIDNKGNNLNDVIAVQVLNTSIIDEAVTDGKFILQNIPIPENKIITLNVVCAFGITGIARINLRECSLLDEKTYHSEKVKVTTSHTYKPVVPAKVRTPQKKGTLLRTDASPQANIKTLIPENEKVDILFYYPDRVVVNNQLGRWCCVQYGGYIGCVFGGDLITL